MQMTDVLDSFGGLVSHLKCYAAKLPPIVHLGTVPTGVKPNLEAIGDYEDNVTRIRTNSAGTPLKYLNDVFVESLEAFEAGKLLESVQPLLAVLDHLEQMQRDNTIDVGRFDEARIAEYRAALSKILPGNKPEVGGAGRGL